MLRKRIQNAFKICFGLGALWWLAKDVSFSGLLALAGQGDPLDLGLGLSALLLAMMYFQWTRLHVLIKGIAGSVRTSLEIFYVGALFNNLLPSNIGGDAIRLSYLKNLKPDNWGTPFMLLLLYRVSSFVPLLVGGFVYVAIEHRRLLELLRSHHLMLEVSPRHMLLALAAGVLLLVVLTVLSRKLSAKFRERALGFWNNCRAAFQLVSRRDFFWLVVHTLLFHFFRMLSFYYLARYFGQVVGMWDLVFVVSATAVVAVLPITVAGLGVIEGSISGLLEIYGVAHDPAVAVAFINRMVLLLMAAIGGIVYATTKSDRTTSPISVPRSIP